MNNASHARPRNRARCQWRPNHAKQTIRSGSRMDGLLQARACAPSSLICSTSTDASLWRAFAMMHASATPPPPTLAHLTRPRAARRGNIARAADPPTPRRACQQWCLWWMQYTSRTIPAKPGRRCLEAYLPAATTACQRPRAHGAHVSARGRNNFHPRAHRARPRRLLATPRRLFLAPSLADRCSAESPSGLWPTRNTARFRGGLQRSSSRAAFFVFQSVVRSRTGLSKFAEPYVQEHRP